jgi:hypothetical protein
MTNSTNSDAYPLANAAKALIERLEYVHNHPAYVSVWTINQIHAGPYQGPKYDKELIALREALNGESRKYPSPRDDFSVENDPFGKEKVGQ